MTYALLVMEKVGERAQRDEAAGRELYDRMLRFSEELKARGVLTLSQALTSEANAVRVRREAGRTVLRDGPFSEAKEMIGGFFLLECGTREEAVAIARECPAAEWATIEVRELGPCYR